MLIYIPKSHFGSSLNAQNSEKQILNSFESATVTDLAKNPAKKEPRDIKLEAEVLSQKIAPKSGL